MPPLRSSLLGALLVLAGGPVLRGETELEKASRLFKARAFAQAQATLERLVQADPRNAEAMALLAELQFPGGNYQKAQEWIDRALQVDAARARFHVIRGNALGMQAQQGSFLRAMTLVGDIRGAYEKAIQLEPRNRSARFALFNFYLAAPGVAGGGLDKARALADQTQAVDPAAGHQMKGMIHQRQKDPGAAQAEYRLAMAADPAYAAIYNSLGYVELEMKQVDMALEHFRKQADLDPENPNAFDSLGDGWMAKGNLAEGITAYRRALTLNPAFAPSLRSLGKALERAGQRESAIQHYRQCLQTASQYGMPKVADEAKARLKALSAGE